MNLKLITSILFFSCVGALATTNDFGLIKLGETKEAIFRKYGISIEGTDLPDGASSELFLFQGGTARVLFLDGVAEEITYHRGGSRGDLPIAIDSIRQLAKYNSLGSRWNQVKEGLWVLDDNHAIMQYGKVGNCKNALYVATNKALGYWSVQLEKLHDKAPLEEKEKKSTAPKDMLLRV